MPSSKELARRDKKAFLSDQCKETENNRMGKTRDLFKKIRGNKGTYLVTMGTIEQRNSMNLTEHIKKKCQEYTEELHKKDLNDPDKPQWCDHSPRARHPGVWSQVGLRNYELITMNKTSGGNGIPPELFQILKDDAMKVLYSICQQIWKTQQWPQDCKRSVILIPKKGNAKECLNHRTTALISHAS